MLASGNRADSICVTAAGKSVARLHSPRGAQVLRRPELDFISKCMECLISLANHRWYANVHTVPGDFFEGLRAPGIQVCIGEINFDR